MKRRFNRGLVLLLVFMMLLLSSCRQTEVNWRLGETISVTSDRKDLTDKEVRLIALQYKCLFEKYYEELLSSDFWDRVVAEGVTFETYVKEEYVFRECETLLVLQEEAENLQVSLSDEETENTMQRAKAYFDSLSDDEKAFTGADVDTVYNLLKAYSLSEKVIQKMTENVRLQVSDEESRVADIQVIHVNDENAANYVLEKLSKGESFKAVADEFSLDPVFSYSVSKEDLEESVRDIIFSMSAGELSPVISLEDGCYVVRLTEYYDTLLSVNNKENLLAKRKFSAWGDVLLQAEENGKIRRNHEAWDKISLKQDGNYPFVDLFSE